MMWNDDMDVEERVSKDVCEEGGGLNDDEAEKDWMDALGIEFDDEGSLFDENDGSNDDADVDEEDVLDDGSDHDDGNEGVSTELEIDAVLEGYEVAAAELFSSTQLDTLKQK